MQNMFHGLGQDISCIKFRVVGNFEALFKCSNEADIMNSCGLPLIGGVNWGGGNTV